MRRIHLFNIFTQRSRP